MNAFVPEWRLWLTPLLLLSLSVCHADTFTVTTTADSGPGSLRQAMLDANAHMGFDTVAFSISPGGPQTILPTSALPDLTDPVLVDGRTQPGYAGQPVIEINGSTASAANGLRLIAGGSIVRGLAITLFNRRG